MTKSKGAQNRIGNEIISIPAGFSVVVRTEHSLIVVDNSSGSKYRYLTKNRALDIVNKNLEALRKVSSPEEYLRASEKCEILKQEFIEAKSIFQKLPNKGSFDKSMTFRFVR